MTKTRAITKTMIISLLMFAICLCGFLGLGTLTVSAADTGDTLTSYDLYVGGIQFTSENTVIDSEDNDKIIGSATYNPDDNSLTLDNFEISGLGYEMSTVMGYSQIAIYYNATNTLTVKLIGSNSITAPDCPDADSFGIFIPQVAFEGEGSLSVVGGSSLMCNSYAIKASDITFKGGDITAIGGNAPSTNTCSYGVDAINISIEGGSLSAYGETQAFDVAPTISAAYYDTTKVLYGSTKEEAVAAGYKDIGELSTNYTQKYVCIAPLYTVSFHENGGVSTMESENAIGGVPYTLPACTFIYDGKHFVGWAFSPDDEIITEKTIALTGNITLYAIYADHFGGDEANCNEKSLCEACGEPYGDFNPNKHVTISEWVYFDDEQHFRYCSDCGEYEEYEDHSYGAWIKVDESTHNRTCFLCNETEKTEHSFGEWTVTKEATETETGSKEKTCVCGHSVTEEIPATGTSNGNEGTTGGNGDLVPEPTVDNDGLTGGAIVGIVVGSVAVVGIGGFALYRFVIKKKKDK